MEENEERLIQQWKKSDKKAFGKLVKKYMNEAFLVALGFTHDYDDARDLSQDAFVKAYEARRRFDAKRPFYPWFYRILRNHCLNFVQRRARRFEPLGRGDSSNEERLASRTPTPIETLEKNERIRFVRAAVDRLSVEHREVIVLKDFNGYSYTEMAAMLDIPLGTVMSRLYYARKMLKEIILEFEQNGLPVKETLLAEGNAATGEVI
jgi:RNA polymerase sigma-70 factor (ECF subfamily)